jgi:hypothetical protein
MSVLCTWTVVIFVKWQSLCPNQACKGLSQLFLNSHRLNCFQSPLRSSNGRERSRSRLRTGRSSSTSETETSAPSLDIGTQRSIPGREPEAIKETCRSVEESIPLPCSGADRYLNSWTGTEASSSSTGFPGTNTQVPSARRSSDTGRSSVGLVMEIRPSSVAPPEIDGVEVRPESIASSDTRNLWLEGHPPWISGLGSSESSRLDGISSAAGLSETSLQSLQAVCETTVQHHRVNEMQERLRRYAGLPPSLDIHDLERRGILSAESSSVQSNRVGDASSSTSEDDRGGSPFQSTPASMQAWEITLGTETYLCRDLSFILAFPIVQAHHLYQPRAHYLVGVGSLAGMVDEDGGTR